MYDYKLYLDHDHDGISKGVYEVVNTNESYDREPSKADIAIITLTVTGTRRDIRTVPAARYNWGSGEGAGIGQLVWNEGITEQLEKAGLMSKEQILKALDGLRPSHLSVEEYIKEYGNGDEKKALRIAIRHDWDAMPIPRKRMNEIFIKAMSKK